MANIVNMRHRPDLRRLLDRCPEHGDLVRIDRRTQWGNSFRITPRREPRPGPSRSTATTCGGASVPAGSLWRSWPGLHGKTLACWCSPPRAGLSRRGPRARRRVGRGPNREDLTVTVVHHGAAPAPVRPPPGTWEHAMIRFTHGDIFAQPVEAIVNPVNCVGVAGAGLAPPVQAPPPPTPSSPIAAPAPSAGCGRAACSCSTPARDTPRWIVHFPTKRHWRDRSARSATSRPGCAAWPPTLASHDIGSVAIPPIGCGLERSRLARGAPPSSPPVSRTSRPRSSFSNRRRRRSRAQVAGVSSREEREVMDSRHHEHLRHTAPRWCPISSPRPRRSASCCASPRHPG